MTLTKRSLLTSLGLGGLATVLAGCNTLHVFSVVTPKDGNVRRVAKDVAFGDDPRQSYDVYAPATGKDLPVLVFFYGGGWNSGDKGDYNWMGYALASMGYIVCIPDYRLVPQVVYPVFLEDNALAVKHFVANAGRYGGRTDKLGLVGHSAGGYAAAMLTLDGRYLGTNALGQSPVTACVGISGPYDFYPFDVPASKNAFGQWPEPTQTQPITYARHTNTHFLLLQSRSDKVVGLRNAVNLEARLKAAGDDVRLKVYEGLSHEDTAASFSVPFRGKGSLFADTRAFLAEVMA